MRSANWSGPSTMQGSTTHHDLATFVRVEGAGRRATGMVPEGVVGPVNAAPRTAIAAHQESAAQGALG